jgi:hypothetical protein
MADWHLAPSFVVLQDELDEEFGASRPNDGTIGDQAHAARTSEHNPDNDPDPMPKGAVSAIDIYTSANGKTYITAAEFAKFLAILKKDSRVWYVIHKGFIYSRTHGFAKREYEGSNPHTNHIHISLMQTKTAHDNKSSWGISGIRGTKPAAPKPSGDKKVPTLSKGDKHELVWVLQGFFGLKRTANQSKALFGNGLDVKVKQYQRTKGLVQDGVVGPKTWAYILKGLALPGWKL